MKISGRMEEEAGGTDKTKKEEEERQPKSGNFTTRLLKNIPRCWWSFKSDVDAASSDSDSYENVSSKSVVHDPELLSLPSDLSEPISASQVITESPRNPCVVVTSEQPNTNLHKLRYTYKKKFETSFII